MKLIASAAGVSVFDIENLMGSDGMNGELMQTTQRQKYNVFQKSAKAEIKALKVLVENNKKMFENEYGRITPVADMTIKQFPKLNIPDLMGGAFKGCAAHFKDFGDLGVVACIANFDANGSCTGLRGCDDGNSCSGQACGNLYTCAPNSCPNQSCPILSSCKPNSQILSGSFYEQYKSDPYIQNLMEQYNVTTSDALAKKLDNMFSQRRASMNRQQAIPKN